MSTPTKQRMGYLRSLLNRLGKDLAWVQGALGEPVPSVEGLNAGQVECVIHVCKTTPDVVFP